MEHKVKIIDGQESPDFDVTEGGRWVTFCETHGFFVQHTGRAVARDMAKSPETWCEGSGAYENPPAVEQFFADHPEIEVANAASVADATTDEDGFPAGTDVPGETRKEARENAVAETVKAPRGVKFHDGVCIPCIANKAIISTGEKARDNLRAKKRAVAKNFKITAKDRADKTAEIDAEIAGHAAKETEAKFQQAAHMAEAN